MKPSLRFFTIVLAVALMGLAVWSFKSTQPAASSPTPTPNEVMYHNDQYKFELKLPRGWRDFAVIATSVEMREIKTGKVIGTAPQILVRHPLWTADKPRQDIPIMVLTKSQWDRIMREEISVSAAPIPPSELSRNEKHVFALPARYNYAFLEGWEDVERILQSKPLRAF